MHLASAMYGRSQTVLRSAWWRIGLLGLSLVALAVIPWVVPASNVEVHNVLHHLNFLPFMVAGMLYGWRGALICTICGGVLQLPHLISVWNVARFEASDQIVEMSIFGAAGAIAMTGRGASCRCQRP